MVHEQSSNVSAVCSTVDTIIALGTTQCPVYFAQKLLYLRFAQKACGEGASKTRAPLHFYKKTIQKREDVHHIEGGIYPGILIIVKAWSML